MLMSAPGVLEGKNFASFTLIMLLTHHVTYSLCHSLTVSLIYTNIYIRLCVSNIYCVTLFTFTLLLITAMMSHHSYSLCHSY